MYLVISDPGSKRLSRLSYVLSSIWLEDSNRGQRLRRVLLFVAWQIWKRIFGSPWKVRLFNGLQIKVYPDCDTSPSALYYFIPNGLHISFLRGYLNGGTFVDVGANVGLVSLLVADKVQHAILCEPNPAAVERAKENLAINHLTFEVLAQALSDTVGTIELENAGNVSSCNRTVEGFNASVPTITVQRTAFDHFLRDHTAFPAVSAVKIDVEGHENAVLRGMKEFLRHQRPKLVMFEYLQRTNIKETLMFFEDVGYIVFELSIDGPRIATAQVRPLQDLFACPNEMAAEITDLKR
jgi:FkbM family methyltransferase